MHDLQRQREVAVLLNLRHVLQLGSVFKARAPRGVVVVKCLDAGQRRSAKEQRMAKWASDVGIGPAVYGLTTVGPTACIVMACATADLRLVMASAAALPFTTLRRLWSQAFALVTCRILCRRRYICTDLKPANLLVFQEAAAERGAGRLRPFAQAEVRLNDFDPAYWSRAASPRRAACFNALALLSNALFLSPTAPLAFFPEAALAVARLAVSGDEEVLSELRAQEPLCRRGLYHYAGVASLAQYQEALRARLEGSDAGAATGSLEEALRHLAKRHASLASSRRGAK
jgi:hypothetical protein